MTPIRFSETISITPGKLTLLITCAGGGVVRYRKKRKEAKKHLSNKKPVHKSNRPNGFKVELRCPLTSGPFARLPQVYDIFSSHPVRKTSFRSGVLNILQI